MKKSILLLFITFLFIISFNITVGASGWGFKKNPNHTPPEIGSYQKEIEGTNSFYVGSPDENKVYLTFDAGYDNGNLSGILDTLKDKKVKATFFVTGDFVNRFSDLTKRMVEEGHIVANHSYSHKTINSQSKPDLENDLKKLEDSFQNLTGTEMVKVFRPPKGEFDRNSLLTLKELGYKTVFWSIAFQDWSDEHQRGKEYSYNSVINNLHPGAIILMHTVSKSNREALPDIIDEITNQGYEFALVTEL
ncbi:MAG: polysaccharide deacetylase family protein [Bacilli bacterium]|nr:polysaccharide deacetylase family protein [Bacilli bacterium]